MTHGDKTKAKAGKSGQASAAKKSSGKNGKVAEAGSKSGKAGKTASEKISVKKAAGEKGGPGPSEKGGAEKSDPKGKTGRNAATDSDGFTNPVVAAAFKHAVKKYPNAFRKLTD